MSIPLTAAQITNLAADVRKPRQMVKIILGAQTLRLTTGKDTTWNGNSYVKSGLKVSSVTTGEGGIKSCRVSIINEQQTYSDLAITTGFVFREIKYWKVYGSEPFAVADPILEFTGEIVAIPEMGKIISFDCMTKNAVSRRVSDVVLGPPNIHHLPYNGQKITIGNEVYTVGIS